MAIEVRLEEQTVDKPTQYGTVKRSMNQHKVYILNDDTGKFTHCGYVGVQAFLPLAGFPRELLEDVTEACRQQLGRDELGAGQPPPSYKELQTILDDHSTPDEDDLDDDAE